MMTDSLLVGAVRNREPGAIAAVFDAHAASLYRYSWFLLGDAEAARVVLRDTFVIMDRRIGDLADPATLRAWLYAIARAECLRRGRGTVHPGVPRSDEDPAAVELRAVAVGAIMGLDETLRDVLELTTRHALPRAEIALVLGLSPEKVDDARLRGAQQLRRTLTAELLTRKSSADCDQRGRMLRTSGPRLAEGLRDRLVEHAAACPACRAHSPRNATPVKVFGLVPDVSVPDSLRVRVMSGLTDPASRGYRDFVLYRAGIFDTNGFPRAHRFPARRRMTRRTRIGVGLIALLCLAASVGYLVSTAGGADTATRTIRSWVDPAGPDRGAEPTVRPGRAPGRADPGASALPGRTPRSVPGGPRWTPNRTAGTTARTAKPGRFPGKRASPPSGRFGEGSGETYGRPGGSPWFGRSGDERSVPLGTRVPDRVSDGARVPTSSSPPTAPTSDPPPATSPPSSSTPSRIPQRRPSSHHPPPHHHPHHHQHPRSNHHPHHHQHPRSNHHSRPRPPSRGVSPSAD